MARKAIRTLSNRDPQIQNETTSSPISPASTATPRKSKKRLVIVASGVAAIALAIAIRSLVGDGLARRRFRTRSARNMQNPTMPLAQSRPRAYGKPRLRNWPRPSRAGRSTT